MKKTLTFILALATLMCLSQTKQELISKAEDQAASNYFKNADSTFAQMHRVYPNDSLVIRSHANLYWKYGRAKTNVKLLDQAIKQFTSLDSKYPNNPEIKLFIATATAKRCEAVYYDFKTPGDKKALLPVLNTTKQDLEKYSGQLDQIKYPVVAIAKRDLKDVELRIEQLK